MENKFIIYQTQLEDRCYFAVRNEMKYTLYLSKTELIHLNDAIHNFIMEEDF